MSFLPLDGPAKTFSISLTPTTVVEVKVGSPLQERQVVTLQSLDDDIWVYFGDGINTPTPAQVAQDGFLVFKDGRDTFEAGQQQPLFILSVSVNTSVRVVERA